MIARRKCDPLLFLQMLVLALGMLFPWQAQAAMHDMLVRGMVQKHKRVDARLSPLASNYEAIGKTYELLPRPMTKKATKPEKVRPAAPASSRACSPCARSPPTGRALIHA